MTKTGLFAALAALIVLTAAAPGHADARKTDRTPEDIARRFVQIENIFRPCDGDCAVLVAAGPWLETPLDHLFGLDGDFTAPWDYDYYDGGLVSVSVSRPLATIRGIIDVEPEIGFAKRFGVGHSEEVWAAVNFRLHRFPWNHVVRTSLSIGVGANYAFRIDEVEGARDTESDLEHLLIYLSPEFTIGLPQWPRADLVMRLHHRSGGRDFGFSVIGSNEGGASNFLTAGIRWRF